MGATLEVVLRGVWCFAAAAAGLALVAVIAYLA